MRYTTALTPERIAELLTPFLDAPLADAQLDRLAAYLELLLRWNARFNLTAVRDPENIVIRHFGESLFAARHLLPPGATARPWIDVGSGAGFPGLPGKIYHPGIRMTLIEAQHKKAVFLREVVRALRLDGVEVLAVRAENCALRADVVTLRAVERFDQVLPVAASLLRATTTSDQPAESIAGPPRLALLIGAAQQPRAQELLPSFTWLPPLPIPESRARILLVGSPASGVSGEAPGIRR